ncbi:MAG: T9SS type A sorting domain-containing protein [Flavobacteriales bacterium]|nr:T9SS type A sorting domain-containing protein [Flavobacteriales bacterium]
MIFQLRKLALGALTVLAMHGTAWAQPYCDEAQGTAGFPSDLTCQNSVCSYDAYCCNNNWDSFCASEAASDGNCAACLSSAPPPAAYCDEAQGTAGFPSDLTCQNSVCSYDAYCCSTVWDATCASEAASDGNCAACLTPVPPAAYCDEAQGTAGFPSDPTCETSVCSYDSYCCSTQWDSFCASEAISDGNCATCLSTYVPPTPCVDANPGATIAPSTACPNQPFDVTVTNVPNETGLTYQWYSSTVSNGGPWDPVGTNDPVYSAAQTDITWYYCEVTCDADPLDPASSTVVEVDMNSYLDCYCIPDMVVGCTDNDVIGRVVLNTLDNDPGAGNYCQSGSNPPLGYSDFTGDPMLTTTLQAGGSYNCTVYPAQYSEGYAAWIDYNDDGMFDHPGELIGSTGAGQAAGSTIPGVLGTPVDFPIVLSCNPPLGDHRLRVRCIYATPGNAITPCDPATWGETEDYLITISDPDPCPAPSNLSATVTSLNSADLSWNPGCTETLWDVHVQTAGGGAPPAMPSNPGVTGSPLTVNTLYAGDWEFWVRADCDINGTSSWTGPHTFSIIEGDLCGTAVPINVDAYGACTPTAGTTDMAIAENEAPYPSCLITDLVDVYYSFNSGPYSEINFYLTLGTMTARAVQVIDGCGGSEVFCLGDQDAGTFSVTPGTDYIFRVLTLSSTTGTFDLCLTGPAPPPTNEDCVDATELTVGAFGSCPAAGVTGNNGPSAQDGPTPTCDTFGGPWPDVWYFFNSGPNETVQVDFTNISMGDVVMDVFEGSCGGASVFCQIGAGNFTLPTVMNTDYYIRVSNNSTFGSGGEHHICVSIPPPPPPNDICGDITPLGPIAGGGSVSNSGTSYGAQDNDGLGFALVWEAVTLSECVQSLEVGMCGTVPVLPLYWGPLYTDCSGTEYYSSAETTNTVDCGDGNLTVTYGPLPAGTYYFPIPVATGFGVPEADYQITFTAGATCPPPPVNDDCSTQVPSDNPLSVGNTLTFNGTPDFSTMDPALQGVFPASVLGLVWESFELTECADVTIDFCGNSPLWNDGSLNMYGDCGTLFINSQSYDNSTCGDGNYSIFFVGLSPGQYYYPVFWEPSFGVEGNYVLNVTASAPSVPCATNTTACDAIALSCNVPVQGSTDNLLPNFPANTCPFIDAPSSGGALWYSYTATQDETLTLSTCSANTDFDTRISVFTGPDCNTLGCYTMADDKDNSSCFDQAVVDVYVQNGQTIWIAVHSPSGYSHGNFELGITCLAACAPPVNDVCSGAEAITSNLNDGLGAFTTGDNSCAMNDAFSTCQPYLNNQGLWYTFNAADNAIHYLDLHANAQDGGLSASTLNYTLYSGGCDGDLAASGEVVCALDAQADGILLPTLTPGTQYLLRIDNEGDVGFEGTFSLRLQHPPLDDAGITAVNAPVPGLLCTSTINAQVVLTNFGEHDLTSVEIHYDMDGLNPQVFNWSGNLPYLGTEVVDLPAFVSPYGIHTFNAYTANPNGATDEVPANDASAVAGVDVTGETLVVEVMTDNNPTGLVWEVDDASFLPVASGDGTNWAPNTLESTTVCLTTINGNHFRFFMFDVYGDGLSNTGNGDGYWRLLDENGQILIGDNFDGTIDGIVTPAGTPLTSTYTAHEFDLPVGPSGIPASDCNIFTNTLQNKVYANPVGGVAGYQWEFSDPDAGYIRRIARTYNWVKFGEMVTYPLLPGVTYFARVRVDQGAAGFSDDRWGPGCEMGIDPNQVPGCTSLIDNPNLPTHSCGVTKAFGGSDKIWAQPVVGATQYRFKFENADEGFLRIIAKPSYALVLNWVTYPLQNGVTYDVSVECLVNGQWSGYCGAVCQVTIMNPSAAPAARQLEATEGADMMLWPNPVRDGQVNIQLDGLTDQVHQVSIDVFDVFGKRVQSIQDDRTGKAYLTTVDMRGLAAGTYLVRVTVDGNIHQQRVTVL